MYDPPHDVSWAVGASLVAFILIAGFLVSWLSTDVLRIGRRRYIAVLAGVTAVLTVATARLTDAPIPDLLGHNWEWGLLGAAVTGGLVGFGIRKAPATLRRSGRDLREAQAWEGGVYGLSEGLLLSGLPAFVAWQAFDDGGAGVGVAAAAALVASAAAIAVHHFGYWDYRSPRVLEVIGGCLVLTAGYVLTGSMLAPVLGHVIMHLAGIDKGVELPPHTRVSAAGA